MADDNKRLEAVAAAFLAHHGEPEDMHLAEVSAARHAGAVRHAELFLSMLDAAATPKVAEPAPKPVSRLKPAPKPEPDPDVTEDADENEDLNG